MLPSCYECFLVHNLYLLFYVRHPPIPKKQKIIRILISVKEEENESFFLFAAPKVSNSTYPHSTKASELSSLKVTDRVIKEQLRNAEK